MGLVILQDALKETLQNLKNDGKFCDVRGIKDPTIPQRLRLACRASLFFLSKYILGFDKLTEHLHRPLCEFIQNEEFKRKLVLLPRGHYKSTCATISYPIWLIIQKKVPGLNIPGTELRILLANESATNAERFLAAIEHILETNEILNWLFPDIVPHPSRRKRWNAQEMLVNRESSWPEATIETIGVGGAVQSRHYNCLGGNSLVYTSNGLVPISEVKPKMRVLGINGRHTDVIATRKIKTDKKFLSIRVWGQPEPIECTVDHRILCFDGKSIMWKEAQNLSMSDKLLTPIPNGFTRAISRVSKEVNRLMEDKDFWRFIGYWLAEGCASDGNRIRLTFSKDEPHWAEDVKDIIENLTGSKVSIKKTKSSTLMVSFFNKTVKEILNKFGTHAYNKHIIPAIHSNLNYLKLELIKGYFRGDGHKIKATNRWIANSISRSLIAGMQILLASLGIPSVIQKEKDGGEKVIAGQNCSTRPIYRIEINHALMDVLMGTFPTKINSKPNRMEFIPNFFMLPIKEIEEIQTPEYVYDIQVKEQESFVIPGACVHNCILLDDLIGKEAMESETVMEKTKTWLDYTESLLIDPKRSFVIVIGTRWHKRDIYQHIIDNDTRFKIYSREAIENGKVVFPEQFDMEFFDSIRKKNPMLFLSQYLNNPVDPEKCDFRSEWLKTYEWVKKDDAWFVKYEDQKELIPLSELDIVGAFDPSVDEHSYSSRMAIVFVGMDHKQNVVILDTYANRETVDRIIDKLFNMYRKWRPRVFGIEAVVFSRLYVYILQKEMQKRNYWLNIVPVKVSSNRSKEARIRDALQAVAAQGKLYRLSTMREFDEEFIDFPQGRYKDILDATTHAINLLRMPESQESITEYEEMEEKILRQRNPITGY